MAAAHVVLEKDEAQGLDRRELQLLLRRELGVPLEISLGIVTHYEIAKRNAEKLGNVVDLPEVTWPMPEDYKPTPHEIAVWGFAQIYVGFALGTLKTDLFDSAQKGFGNTYQQTRELLGWMRNNPEKVAGFIEWGWETEKGSMSDVQNFRDRAKEGTLNLPAVDNPTPDL